MNRINGQLKLIEKFPKGQNNYCNKIGFYTTS